MSGTVTCERCRAPMPANVADLLEEVGLDCVCNGCRLPRERIAESARMEALENEILTRPREWLVPLLYEHLLSSLRRASGVISPQP